MVATMRMNNVPSSTAAKLAGGASEKKLKAGQLGLVEDLFVVFEDCWNDFKERALQAIRAKKLRLIGAVEDHAFDEQSFQGFLVR